MQIQRVKILRRTTALGSTHSGQYRFDHLLAKDQQRRQRADAGSAHPVAPRFTDPLHKRLAPHLAQVITRFALGWRPKRREQNDESNTEYFSIHCFASRLTAYRITLT